MKGLICGLLFLISSLSSFASDFEKANQESLEGRYSGAIELYEGVIAKGELSSALYYNLASTFYRDGKIGKAVFYFKKALELNPRDADTSFNLGFIREKVRDRIEEKSSWLQKLFTSYFVLRPIEVDSLCVFAFLALLVCLLFRKKLSKGLPLSSAPLSSAALGLACTLLLGSLSLWILREKFDNRIGVVVAPELKVYSGLGRDSVVLFTLHEGAEFSVLENRNGEWFQIQLSDGKKGWLRSEEGSKGGSEGESEEIIIEKS